MGTYLGDVGEIEQRNDVSFVHGQGWSQAIEERGKADKIEGRIPQYIWDGWEVEVTPEGDGYSRLTANRQSDKFKNSDQEYYDRFTLTKETVEKDIWSLEALHTEAALPTSAHDWKEYKALILEAVQTGKEEVMVDAFNTLASGEYPAAWNVYIELCRGAEAYEDEYIVMTRERVVSIDYIAELMPIQQFNASTIYPTSSLSTVFGIPVSFIGITLPVDPTTAPANSVWGWRNRRKEIRYQEGNRVELVMDWVYAAWSTNLYTPYSP